MAIPAPNTQTAKITTAQRKILLINDFFFLGRILSLRLCSAVVIFLESYQARSSLNTLRLCVILRLEGHPPAKKIVFTIGTRFKQPKKSIDNIVPCRYGGP